MMHLATAPAPSVRCVDTIAHLDVFKDAGTAAVVFQRHVPSDVQTWLNAVPVDNLPSGRVILRPDIMSDVVRQLCDMVNLPEGPQRDWLEADIVALAERLADVMDAPFLRLRLDVVNTNACRKFHIDAVTGRLICTYRGVGTQYGFSHDGGDPRRILTVDTGSPILLKGTLWPDAAPTGLLHRSPPIEGTGETRLLLVLDPIYDPTNEV